MNFYRTINFVLENEDSTSFRKNKIRKFSFLYKAEIETLISFTFLKNQFRLFYRSSYED
jgi:hypothetical protein